MRAPAPPVFVHACVVMAYIVMACIVMAYGLYSYGLHVRVEFGARAWRRHSSVLGAGADHHYFLATFRSCQK